MGKSIRSAESIVRIILSNLMSIKWILIFFIPFLVAQLVRISVGLWDSQVYILNGQWFCGQHVYFEFLRPPLPAFVNCLFGAIPESLLISTFVFSVVYLWAVVIIYHKHKASLNQFIFAAFSFLFPPLLFGANFGSDLPALAFLLLAFAFTSPALKGVSFALATLSRYNYFVFIIVFLFELRKGRRNMAKFLLPVLVLWLPWLAFNYFFTGNPFFSVLESSYLNVVLKPSNAPLLLDHILLLFSFIILVFANRPWKGFSVQLNAAAVINAVIFLLSKIKEIRFLDLLVPVIAFNAASLAQRGGKYFWTLLLFLVVMLLISPFFFFVGSSTPSVPEDEYLKQCRVASDNWVFFYPHGIVAECSFDISDWKQFVADGGNIVLYYYSELDLNSFDVINRGEYVIIKSASCAPQPKKYLSGVLRNDVYKWLRDTNSQLYDYSDWVN